MRYYAAVFALYSPSVKPKQQNGLQNKFPRTKLYLTMWFDLQLGRNIFHKYPKYINNHILWCGNSFMFTFCEAQTAQRTPE